MVCGSTFDTSLFACAVSYYWLVSGIFRFDAGTIIHFIGDRRYRNFTTTYPWRNPV